MLCIAKFAELMWQAAYTNDRFAGEQTDVGLNALRVATIQGLEAASGVYTLTYQNLLIFGNKAWRQRQVCRVYTLTYQNLLKISYSSVYIGVCV